MGNEKMKMRKLKKWGIENLKVETVDVVIRAHFTPTFFIIIPGTRREISSKTFWKNRVF